MSDGNNEEHVAADAKENDKDASFCAEALIKEVAVTDADQVSFKLEPTSPYVFEMKNDNGATERCLLFVDDAKKPCKAEIVATDQDFAAPKPVDFNALLIAKANRLRVRITVIIDKSDCIGDGFKTENRQQIQVEKFKII